MKHMFDCARIMEEMGRKKQRLRSIIILIAVAALTLGMIAVSRLQGNGAEAVVTVDGKAYATLSLNEDTALTVEDGAGGYNRIEVKDGTVFVSEADCANQVCVNTAAISRNGQVIACIPHGLVITVTDAGGEVDAVAY